MAWFEKALEAKVMSTHLLIRANVSKKILYQAYQIATDFEDRYSAYKEDSFLNAINKNAGLAPLSCTPADYTLFATAQKVSAQTDGLFDITIGALSHGAYHYGFSNESKPSPLAIEKQKNLVNHKDIVLTPTSILLKKRGMRLDLGGIGKGYVARQIALYLEKMGATKLLVDVGGEIITRGKSYSIAIKNPFSDGNSVYIQTTKADISISTSGSYERFIDEESHHILSQKNGLSPKHYNSMSILQNGWNIHLLDAYATALFNQPSNQLKKYCDTLGISLIAINKDKTIIQESTDALALKSLKFL